MAVGDRRCPRVPVAAQTQRGSRPRRLPPCEICVGHSCKELRAVKDRGRLARNARSWSSMAGSAVMILHGFRAGSPVVTDTGCCLSAARRRRPDLRNHNLICPLTSPSCLSWLTVYLRVADACGSPALHPPRHGRRGPSPNDDSASCAGLARPGCGDRMCRGPSRLI